MPTSFGPQGPNFSTTRPATVPQASGGADSWCVDCSAAGAKDGTILDASFFNIIIANLRTLVSTAGVTLDDSDTQVYQAVQAVVTATIGGLFSGTKGVRLNGFSIELALGQGTLSQLDDSAMSSLNDLLPVYNAAGTLYAEATLYNIVKSVIDPTSTGVTFTDATGIIRFTGITQTAAATAPGGANLGDEWYDTSTDRLFKYVSDGTTSFWREI